MVKEIDPMSYLRILTATVRMTMLMPKKVTPAVLMLTLCLVMALHPAAAEEEITIKSRDGVTVSFIVNEPDHRTKATAILFAGGNGKLKLWKGKGTRSNNFLVRSRTLFAARGILTLTVDVPSDRRRMGMNNFRDSEKHRADIAAIVRWVRKKTNAPVWLIGTSRGTVSLSHLAGKLPIDGVVYTASVTEESGRRPATALDGDLEAITTPVLLAHHNADGCTVTPVWGLLKITDRLKKAAKVEIKTYTGGDPDISGPCKAKSKHGFIGLEAKVVDDIVRWMLNNAP
jgi:dienelactone hydrolase